VLQLRNHQRICDVMIRVTPGKETSIRRSNAPNLNAKVVVNVLVHVWMTIWMTMRRETKSQICIRRSMDVRSGAIKQSTKANRGKRSALGMVAARVLSVPERSRKKRETRLRNGIPARTLSASHFAPITNTVRNHGRNCQTRIQRDTNTTNLSAFGTVVLIVIHASEVSRVTC